VVTNRAEAREWLLKAAQADNGGAQVELGYQCEYPQSDGPLWRAVANLPDAVRWYRRAADLGWAVGQYHLGLCYLEGKGVEQDEERALELMRSSADQENPGAMSELAGMYARGIGEPRTAREQPLQLLERITKLIPPDPITGGSEYAYDGIVYRYQQGLGAQRDLVAAAQWYCRAALAGAWEYSLADKLEDKARSLFRGGKFNSTPDRGWVTLQLDTGLGEHSQFLRVLSIYLQASLNHPDALRQIGELYLAGQDVPKDGTKAWVWLTLATQNGSSEARAKLTALESNLTGKELTAAKQLLAAQIQELKQVAAATPMKS
jgi:hypothetical protein